MGKYRRNLERSHQPEARHVGRRQRRDVLALVDDAAACGLEKLGQQIETGGLAGTVRSDQGMNGATLDTQVDASHGYKPGEVLGEILRFENGFGARQLDVPFARTLSLSPGPAPVPSAVGV